MSTLYENALFNTPDVQSLSRALALLVLDEFNAHTDTTNAILTAIGNANTLAEVKAAVGAIVPLPTRTQQQLIDALKAKIGQ
jgi:hypothetical protein